MAGVSVQCGSTHARGNAMHRKLTHKAFHKPNKKNPPFSFTINISFPYLACYCTCYWCIEQGESGSTVPTCTLDPIVYVRATVAL